MGCLSTPTPTPPAAVACPGTWQELHQAVRAGRLSTPAIACCCCLGGGSGPGWWWPAVAAAADAAVTSLSLDSDDGPDVCWDDDDAAEDPVCAFMKQYSKTFVQGSRPAERKLQFSTCNLAFWAHFLVYLASYYVPGATRGRRTVRYWLGSLPSARWARRRRRCRRLHETVLHHC